MNCLKKSELIPFLFHILEKNEVKLYYDSFECVFSSFDLVVKDTVILGLSTNINKIKFCMPFNDPSSNSMNTAVLCFLGTKFCF